MTPSTIHSADELKSLILELARKYSVNKVTVSTGFRHTLIYNYNSFEVNFIVNHDMTVVSPKGNVCELQPKESTLYTIWSTVPMGFKQDGVVIEYGFSEYANKAVMDKIFDSLDYKQRGLVPPTWLRSAASYVISVTDEAALAAACRLAMVHVNGRKMADGMSAL